MRKVLACIDASVYATSVCDHAAWAALRMPAKVEVLHVLDRLETSRTPIDLSGSIGLGANETLLNKLTELDEQSSRIAQERGRALVDGAVKRLREAGVTEVTPRLRHGAFLETVIEAEADADVVVIGKRGEHADFDKLHLGGKLERVVRTSKLPVLVAARAFKPIAQVVTAFDGSPSARKAIERIGVRPIFEGLKHHVVLVGADSAQNQAHLAWARETMAAHAETAEFHLLPGAPETAIAEFIEQRGGDLLVMGAYGHSRIREFIVGSTTTALVRTCQIPVLMFR
ncbi:MAG: universal stress protein [Terricaulis sp.]